MSTLKFKTNINCGGCLKAVTPRLDDTLGIQAWSVDTEHPDKILSVQTTTLDTDAVIAIVQQTGFNAEAL